MKLYTEEQLKEVISIYNTAYFVTLDELLDNFGFTPIELPSDEEIENEYKPKTMYDIGWLDGAKWIKEQILNQNK